MKKLVFILLIGLAVNVCYAQQLPTLRDTVGRFNLHPLFTDSLAKWPRLNRTLPNKIQLKTDALVYSTMPLVKPLGNHKTPVVNTATPGVNYTMMIKKIGIEKPVEPIQP